MEKAGKFRRRKRRHGAIGLAGLIAAVSASSAQAVGTPAGTTIDNVATASYERPEGGEASVTSNKVSLKVDELLDVTVVAADPGDVPVAPGATGQVLAFTVTNAGNGSEGFALAARDALGGDDFNPSATSIVLDSNSNGAYDAGVDTEYVAGSNDPVLAPDASLRVFVLSSIPADAMNGGRGRVDLVVTASTGSGSPGTSLAGAGQGGGNAVVGATGATTTVGGYYAVTAASLSFVKSAVVVDQFGGTSPVRGSIITYSLTATVKGSGSLTNLRIADPIPAQTSFKAGSITLDGTPLSDADDGDAARFTGTGIAVALGNLAAGSTRTVTFQVTID